jgi:hypothetical protein
MVGQNPVEVIESFKQFRDVMLQIHNGMVSQFFVLSSVFNKIELLYKCSTLSFAVLYFLLLF